MKKLSIILLLFIFPLIVKAQDDEVNLIGIHTKSDFLKPPYAGWFNENYNDYKPDQNVVNALKNHLKDVKIKAFMGTWCSDSQHEVPRFFKLMEQAGFDFKNLTLVAVNRDKETPDHLEAGMNITNVPTFIFYKNGKEIGRFVEYPRETLEKDILKIVSGKPYKHSYED